MYLIITPEETYQIKELGDPERKGLANGSFKAFEAIVENGEISFYNFDMSGADELPKRDWADLMSWIEEVKARKKEIP